MACFTDAFTDITMWRIVDSYTDKKGERFRPWIRRMALPVVLCSILLYNSWIIDWPMISDCIDNYFVKTGKHSDGTIYAIYSFVQKFSGAVTSSIGAWSLAIISYDNLAVVQTNEVRQSIYSLNILLPAIFILIALGLMLFYPLNRRRVEENAIKLQTMEKKKPLIPLK